MSDYISREAVLEHYRVTDPAGTFAYCNSILDFVSNLPAADVKPVVRGKWTFKKIFPDDESEFPIGHLVCSVCGESYPNRTPKNFYPNCGATMKEENHG